MQQLGQFLDLCGQLRLRFRLLFGAKLGQQQGVLAVGLGPPALAFGEIAHLLGIGQADLPTLAVGVGHQAQLIAAGRL